MPESTPMSHERWMQEALQRAQRSLPRDVPVGALLVDEAGKIIAEGWNTRELAHDPAGHAEMMALQAAGLALENWRMSGLTLYVTLEPCPMCASALLQARIGTIVYGADDPVQGALGSALNLATLYTNPVKVLGGVLAEICQAQLQEFFQARRG